MMVSFLPSSLKTCRLIFMWPSGCLWHWPWWVHLESPVLLEIMTQWGRWHKTSVTLKAMVRWRWGIGIGAAHRSCHLWLWSQACHDVQCWCNAQWVWLGSAMCLFVLWSLSSCGGLSRLSNLNGGDADRHVWWYPGPLASKHCSVMA